MKKAVVTGGAGFIGSHLAEALAGRGYQVVVLDDLSTGKMENIAHLVVPRGVDRSSGSRATFSGATPSATSCHSERSEESQGGGSSDSPNMHPSVEFVHGSITDLALLQDVFHGAHYVFHQAAIPSVPRSIDDPLSSHEANATGTLNVLIAARDCGVRKVVYASSCAVYGDNPNLPLREDMLPRPLSPYAVAKLTGEHYAQVFCQAFALPTVSLRYFNVYGPRQDPTSQYSGVIARFMESVSKGEPPIIFGDGRQTRDFVFVRDVVYANILAAQNNVTGVFNIGTGTAGTLSELSAMIAATFGEDLTPVYDAPRPGDIKHSLADIARAAAWGYSPQHTLAQGLKETVGGMLPSRR